MAQVNGIHPEGANRAWLLFLPALGTQHSAGHVAGPQSTGARLKGDRDRSERGSYTAMKAIREEAQGLPLVWGRA